MNHFTAEDTFIIVGIVIAYILFTTWLTFRIRSKNSGDFMEGSRAGNDSNLLIVFYVQIMPDDLVMQLHR
ncbi:hypothetical protein VZ122_16585, partial [Klebsiella pneumoniae]